MTYAPNKDSDQPEHPPSLISVFFVRMKKAIDPYLPIYRIAKTDPTGRMSRLIWAFAGRTGHFVCFVMLRLIIPSYFDQTTVSFYLLVGHI